MKIFNCTPKRIAAVIDTNTNVVEGKILDKPTKFVWEPWQFLDIPNHYFSLKKLAAFQYFKYPYSPDIDYRTLPGANFTRWPIWTVFKSPNMDFS